MPNRSIKLTDDERVNLIIAYIDRHLQNPTCCHINLDSLSNAACLSHFHLSRIFKSYMGESIHQYIKRLRLENAAKRLHYSKDSIQGIAESCTYKNLPAFTKAFKQRFGYSPREFREKKITLDFLQDMQNAI